MSTDDSQPQSGKGVIDISTKAKRVTEKDRDDVKRGRENKLVPTRPSGMLAEKELPLQTLSAGSLVSIYGQPVEIKTTGMAIIDSGRHGFKRVITKFGFDNSLVGTECQLYVDRDPYLLNVANGPVWEIDPDDVSVNS